MTSPAEHALPPLHVEFDTDEACPIAFGGDSSVVLYFASWAFSLRFGAQHELAKAASRIETLHKVALRPLLRYADRRVEDEADRRELQRMWQDPAALADCCRAVAAATTAGDRQLNELLEGYEDLAPRLGELAAMCDWAAAQDAHVRLSFDLGEPGPPVTGD
ncbi:MAG: hypothetical protein F4X76_03840 [Chloroflexi bacterium]|nr:hypothetical protein [Chloroflexota bacterium]